ncbi:MAG: hypothetical protein JJT94_14520 [Bernardetiaceae bacterium]|nr:hypothetical protein [Bernardetiaceae bacterium]
MAGSIRVHSTIILVIYLFEYFPIAISSAPSLASISGMSEIASQSVGQPQHLQKYRVL